MPLARPSYLVTFRLILPQKWHIDWWLLVLPPFRKDNRNASQMSSSNKLKLARNLQSNILLPILHVMLAACHKIELKKVEGSKVSKYMALIYPKWKLLSKRHQVKMFLSTFWCMCYIFEILMLCIFDSKSIKMVFFWSRALPFRQMGGIQRMPQKWALNQNKIWVFFA